MISRFLAKIVIGIAVVAIVGGELGSPLVVRAQLDGVAHDAANEAALSLARSGSAGAAQGAADQIVTEHGASLRSFQIDAAGTVTVGVAREAPSLVLKKWDKAKSWYDVVVSVSAVKRGP